jgi:hypothetical protein
MPNGRRVLTLRTLEFNYKASSSLALYGRGRETRPDIWAPGAGGANGATGYLIGQAAGSYVRRSEDRKAVRETSLSGDPEYLTEEAKTDLRFDTDTKEVMGEG